MEKKWIGPAVAYQHLAYLGITPNSTMQAIGDANFEIMAMDGVHPDVNEAWEQLQRLHIRLEADFFLFQVLTHE